jgi:hypothetical protein
MTENEEPSIPAPKQVKPDLLNIRKKIGDITTDEQEIMKAALRAGKTSPFYELKVYKNGKDKIINKKSAPPPSQPAKPSQPNVSDLLWNRVAKLEKKYTKLKAKYEEQFVDDDEIAEAPPDVVSEVVPEAVPEQPDIPNQQEYIYYPRSWRDRMRYI